MRDPEGFRLIAGSPLAAWELTETIVPEAGTRILAPVTPSKIVAIGLNYVTHAKEMGMDLPQDPLIFLKPPTALAHPGDRIIYPSQSQQVDFEGELAVVIGRKTRHVSEEEAPRAVMGYTLANDVTARDLQKRDGQWARAKGFDGFCPLGPCLATELELEGLEFRTWLNDELKQTGKTADMIFSVPRIVSFVSTVMTLMPGDVILTGTPPGIAPMNPGDRIRIECDSIGALENRVARE